MSVFVLLGTSVQLFVILLKSGLSSWKSIMTCLTILGEQLLFRGAISPPLGPGGIHFKSLLQNQIGLVGNRSKQKQTPVCFAVNQF